MEIKFPRDIFSDLKAVEAQLIQLYKYVKRNIISASHLPDCFRIFSLTT